MITGTFEPDVGSIKVPFVQMRVNHHGQWLMNDLTIFVLPAEKAHASRATDTNKVARPAASRPVAWIQKTRKLDTNKDDKIVKAEFLKACEDRFAQLDRDRDGSITRIDVIKLVAELKAKNTPTAKAVGVKKAKTPTATSQPSALPSHCECSRGWTPTRTASSSRPS